MTDQPLRRQARRWLRFLEELETKRQGIRDRFTQLTLLKDSLVANETYALSKRICRYAGLISEKTPSTGYRWPPAGLRQRCADRWLEAHLSR